MNATQDERAGSKLALLLRAVFELIVSFAIWGGLLFFSARDFTWARGWLVIGVWIATFAVNAAVLLRLSPEVMSARLKPKPSSERADTIILTSFLPVILAIPLIGGLDAVRHGWSSLPFWCIYPGIALHAAGDVLLLWTMVANPFLEKTVRVQAERGHRVITTGPYAIVRHPMYLALVLMFLAIPLMFGSVWTFVPVAVMALLLMVRTILEERLLRRDLPGYEQYIGKTRWRIIPGIW